MSLLNFLKGNKNARKIFGRRELKIIEKQLLGINLTQSEKNRLSRDIRRKFEFIRKAARFEDKFSLRKGDEIMRLIEEAQDEILKDQFRHRIKEIWMFGSAIENSLTFRSDIDIAVIFETITKKEAFSFRARISGRVSDKMDIQVFNVLPEKIKKDIMGKHKVLYRR